MSKSLILLLISFLSFNLSAKEITLKVYDIPMADEIYEPALELVAQGKDENFKLAFRFATRGRECNQDEMEKWVHCRPFGEVRDFNDDIEYNLDEENNFFISGYNCGKIKFQNAFQSFFGGDSALFEKRKHKVKLNEQCSLIVRIDYSDTVVDDDVTYYPAYIRLKIQE